MVSNLILCDSQLNFGFDKEICGQGKVTLATNFVYYPFAFHGFKSIYAPANPQCPSPARNGQIFVPYGNAQAFESKRMCDALLLCSPVCLEGEKTHRVQEIINYDAQVHFNCCLVKEKPSRHLHSQLETTVCCIAERLPWPGNAASNKTLKVM